MIHDVCILYMSCLGNTLVLCFMLRRGYYSLILFIFLLNCSNCCNVFCIYDVGKLHLISLLSYHILISVYLRFGFARFDYEFRYDKV